MFNRVTSYLFASALSLAGCEGAGLGTTTQELAPVGDFLTLTSPFNTLGFAAQDIGTVSAGQQLTLSNSGTINLSLTTFAFAGIDPGDFAFGPLSTCTAGTVLAPGATCTIDVTFAPTAAGPRSTRITIVDSANGTPHAIPVTGVGNIPGAPVAMVGPIDLRIGYPAFYQDVGGLKLQPCYDHPTMCLATLPNPLLPPLVADVGSNFINEVFYWNAQVQNVAVGAGLKGRATLTLALEGAQFNNAGALIPGDQIVFGRVRIKITKLDPNTNYTITHPYGSKVLVSDSGGTIVDTSDIGCGATPCDFRQALDSPILAVPFLRWDPAQLPAAPAGFLGDPTIPHAIVGSPTGNNFFRIVGPHAGGATNTVTFTSFTVSGEILP